MKTVYWMLVSFLIIASLASCGKEQLPSIDSLIQDATETPEIQRFVPQKLFPLSSLGIGPYSKNSQGMDIYNDDILFQAGVENTLIHLISLKDSKVLGSVEFATPTGEPCHMNNINCGPKYNLEDSFPILYLSQTTDSKACFVLRISNDASHYELIQTIRYDGADHYKSNSSFDWFIDLQNNLIYTYGKYNGNANQREIMKFSLPPLENKEVIFTDKDILDSFVLDNQSIYQGSKIIDGLLYCPVGYGNTQHPGRLIIIDLDKKEVVNDIPLNCGEPESIGQFKNGAIICGGGRNPLYYFIRL